MAKGSSKPASGSDGAVLGFEATLWADRDKLRDTLDAAEYKHVGLGLILLKHMPDAFAEGLAALLPKLLSGELRVPTAEKESASHA